MPRTGMLKTVDHIGLLTRDFDRAVQDYEVIFRAAPAWQSQDTQFKTVIFQSGNAALEIISPVDDSSAKNRVDEILGNRDSALTTLVFAVDNIDKTHHVLTRRGLNPGDVSDGESQDLLSNQTRNWQMFRCDDAACAGIKTFILQHKSKPLTPNMKNGLRLDHLVINTSNPDRSIAHYGARLGIRFALDRTIDKFGVRFLFFKLGDLVLEIIHKPDSEHVSSGGDHIWGLTWKVEDLERAHERLRNAGVTVSDIRIGRKPGTKVFTVKSHSAGIPTLFLALI